jgi:hypothetical protein
MKKPILLAAMLTGILTYSQEKVNVAELKKIANQEEKALEEAKANVTTNIFDHTYPEDVSFQGMNNGVPVFIASDARNQINSMDVDKLHNGTIPGYTITGNGMTAYIWDGGLVRTTHQEFGGRVTNVETSGSNSDHATGVAGVVIGAGVNANARGMAYEANLKALNFTVGSTTGEMSNQSSLPENQDYMVSNHSYGSLTGWYYNQSQGSWYWYGYPHISETESVLFGYYAQNDATYDNVARNAPQHSIFKSSGNNNTEGPNGTVNHFAYGPGGNWVEFTGVNRPNDCVATGGYDCLTFAGSTAKNLIIVGAVNPLGGTNYYEEPSDVVVAYYSGSGPTDDGRIKPDITAIGSSVLSANNPNDAAYSSWSGTSFSSPAAAGVGLLLQQVKNQKDGGYLRSDMMKALLINTANEAGPNLGPDYKFGFGLIDALKAAQTIINVNEDSFTADLSLTDGGSYTRSFEARGGEPLKVSIAWLDPAGSVTNPMILNDRTPKLVNDLDLRIESNGTTYYPWKLNPDNPSAAATQADNVVDNVEQVFIETPTAGQTYTINVTHKGTLTSGSQNFALVVNGVVHLMGTNDVSLNDAVNIYPNPVVDNLNIQLSKNLNNATVKIFNPMGEIAYDKKFATFNGKQSIDMKSFPAGIYMVYIKSDEGTITKKVIKK